MKIFAALILLFGLGCVPLWAVQIVTDGSNPYCEEVSLLTPLRIYRDPALILESVKLLGLDGSLGWDAMLDESPVLTTLGTGAVHIMKLGKPQPFKHYSEIESVYELADLKLRARDRSTSKGNPLIVPIKICGAESYNDTLGFMFVSDWNRSQQLPMTVEGDSTLPPSTLSHPVPDYSNSKGIADTKESGEFN
jgi:hypothetical protein